MKVSPFCESGSLVSFSRIVLFADRSFRGPVRLQIVPRKIPGDIVVLKHCANIKDFCGDGTGITGKFLSDRSFRGPVRSRIVPRKNPGDIVVLQHCPNIVEFYGYSTSITGKFLSDRSFADQCAHKSFRENSSGNIAVLANCKSLSLFYASQCRDITGKFLSDHFSS